MTLWERVIEWKQRDKNYPAGDWGEAAAELEADLRELRIVVEMIPHAIEPILDGKAGVHQTACPHCALEARIGGEK